MSNQQYFYELTTLVKLLGVSKRKLREISESAKVEPTKFGRKLVWMRPDVEKMKSVQRGMARAR